MNTIRVLFTKREWNPVSLFIRWCVPRSRFYFGLSSHCIIVDGEYAIEAHMLYGVRRVKYEDSIKGLTIIKDIRYNVDNAIDGLSWARTQVGRKYDWRGALGLAIELDRDWQNPDMWFCYELAATTLAKAGRDDFNSIGHITESVLLSIKH